MTQEQRHCEERQDHAATMDEIIST
jgi:hypothetical protein